MDKCCQLPIASEGHLPIADCDRCFDLWGCRIKNQLLAERVGLSWQKKPEFYRRKFNKQ